MASDNFVQVTNNPKPYDSLDAMKERIAYKEKTLPRLIVFGEGITTASREVPIINLVKSVNDDDDFRTFYERYNRYATTEFLVEAYTYARRDLMRSEQGADLVLAEINTVAPDVRRLPSLDTMKAFRKEYKEKQDAFKELTDVEPYEMFSRLIPMKYRFAAYCRGVLDIGWTTTENVLDRLVLTEDVPVAYAKSHWKVLSGTTGFPTETKEMDTDAVYLFLRQGEDQFMIVSVSDGKEQGYRVEAEISATDDNQEISAETVLQKIGTVLSLTDVELTRPEITSTRGKLVYFGIQFNPEVLADILLNDSVISQWFYKDDLIKVSRETQGLFIYFTPSQSRKLAMTLTTANFADATNAERRFYGKTHTDGGYTILEIKCAETESMIELIKISVNGLLRRYSDLQASYSKIYSKYLKNWSLLPQVERSVMASAAARDVLKTSREGRAVEPRLFPHNLSRKCPPDRQPWVILNPDEIERIKATENPDSWLEFPRPDEYPLNKAPGEDWIVPRFYTCANRVTSDGTVSDRSIVSMVPIPPAMNPQVPLAPCCVKPNADGTRPTLKLLDRWLEGESVDFQRKKRAAPKNNPFVTEKIAPSGGYAILPDPLQKILAAVSVNGSWNRYGVESRENSAIEAVALAKGLHPSTEQLREYRESRDVNPIVCAQENSGKSPQQLEAEIRGTGYLSPRKYYRYLEELFEVRIVLFIITKDTGGVYTYQSVNGQYFFLAPDRPVVCLVEHMGAERDLLEFPQTELIGLRIRNKIVKQFTDERADLLASMRTQAARFVLWSKRQQQQQQQSVPLIPNVTKQVVDQYGKCRGVLVQDKCFLEIPPSPPYNASVMGLDEIPRFTRWDKLEERYGVRLTRDTSDPRKPGVVGEFPVVVVSEPPGPDMMEIFARNKRYARILTELYFYTFAEWWRSQQDVLLTTAVSGPIVDGFNQEMTTVIPEYSYPDPEIVLADNSGFYRKNRLILQSETMQNRLKYVLLHEWHISPRRVLGVLDTPYVRQFYMDRSDFQRQPGVSLVNNSMIKVYQNMRHTEMLKLFSTPKPGMTEPYFLLLDQKVFLARNFSELDDAVNSGIGWQTNGRVTVVPAGVRWGYRLYVTQESQERYLIGPEDGVIARGFEVLGYLHQVVQDEDTVEVPGYTVVYW